MFVVPQTSLLKKSTASTARQVAAERIEEKKESNATDQQSTRYFSKGSIEEEQSTSASVFNFCRGAVSMFNEVVEILVKKGNLDRETTERLMAQRMSSFFVSQEFVVVAKRVAQYIMMAKFVAHGGEVDSAHLQAVQNALQPVEDGLQAWILKHQPAETSESSQ